MNSSAHTQPSAFQQLVLLRQLHRELDRDIEAMTQTQTSSQFELSRLKKRKLLLKDQIAWLESALIPDLLA